MPTAGRPLVNLSLAINYHFGKLNPWGYHVFNLVVHWPTALLVGLIVKRIVELDFFAGQFAGASRALAFVAALLWGVHPLQTETVVYVTQAHGVDGRSVLFGDRVWELEVLVGEFLRQARAVAKPDDGSVPGWDELQGSDGHRAGHHTTAGKNFGSGNVSRGDSQIVAAVCWVSHGLGFAGGFELRRPEEQFGGISSGCSGVCLVVHPGESVVDVLEAGRVAVAFDDSLFHTVFANDGRSLAMGFSNDCVWHCDGCVGLATKFDGISGCVDLVDFVANIFGADCH